MPETSLWDQPPRCRSERGNRQGTSDHVEPGMKGEERGTGEGREGEGGESRRWERADGRGEEGRR